MVVAALPLPKANEVASVQFEFETVNVMFAGDRVICSCSEGSKAAKNPVSTSPTTTATARSEEQTTGRQFQPRLSDAVKLAELYLLGRLYSVLERVDD